MPLNKKTHLPQRHYYRLNYAAQALGCMPEDLLHCGASELIEICACPPPSMLWALTGPLDVSEVSPVTVTLIPKFSLSEVCPDKDLYDLSHLGDEDNPEGNGPYLYAFLRGLFSIDPDQLRQIEVYGSCLWSYEIGYVSPCNTTPDQCCFRPAERSDEKIVIEDLFITHKTFEKIRAWPNNKESHELRSSINQALPAEARPHGNAERFATNRESVLKAAIYCKDKWPENCKTFTEWAETIEINATQFWPKLRGETPLSRSEIEKLIGKAHKSPTTSE